MARLPVQGQDENAWGSILNEFLEVVHNLDGTLKNVPQDSGLITVSAAQLKNLIASPVTLVPAQGANLVIAPLSLVAKFTFGTTPFNGYAFVSLGGHNYSSFLQSMMQGSQTVEMIDDLAQGFGEANGTLSNQPLTLSTDNLSTVGDGSFKLRLLYHVYSLV